VTRYFVAVSEQVRVDIQDVSLYSWNYTRRVRKRGPYSSEELNLQAESFAVKNSPPQHMQSTVDNIITDTDSTVHVREEMTSWSSFKQLKLANTRVYSWGLLCDWSGQNRLQDKI
jgi:hypothetical protein